MPISLDRSRWIAFLGASFAVVIAAALWRLGNEVPRLLWEEGGSGAIDLGFYHRGVRVWFSGEPFYGVIAGGDFPPASYAMLAPVLGPISFSSARWVWTGAMLLALGVLAVLLAGASCPRPGREGALENALERAVVLGFVFGAYPASAAIRVGQLGPFVVLALVGAALLLTDRTEPARLSRDGLGATLLVLAQVKPTLSIPFVPLILLRAGRVRPAAFAALGYGAISVLSTTLRGEDPVTPVLAWLRLGGSLHYFLEGHANLYKVLALTGGQSLALPASLVLLAGLAIWVHRRPGVDVWTAVGVTALVARLWTHHRLHDDVLLLLPIVALARIARDGSGSRASRIATAALLVNAALLLAPARVLALPLPTALLLEGPQVVVWVGTLVFLATRSEATRGENDEAGAPGHARAPA